ncbi:MAG: hypothetical protein J1F36_06065, partial [Clostridiales bacterium]|nr:hypothetical protein [Clostridiales bacterium]
YQGDYETTTEGEGDNQVVMKDLNSYNHGLFNMEIGFKRDRKEGGTDLLALPFEKFIITFESQQYSKTEDGKTVNYIIFFPEGEDGVKVAITDDKDIDASKASETVLNRDHINIKFVEAEDGLYHESGVYHVVVSNGEENEVEGDFENIGGNYAKYSSSSTTPVYPLIFNAEFLDWYKANFEERFDKTTNKYDDVFFKFMEYVEKLYTYLPEQVAQAKLFGFYQEEGKFSHNGEYTIDVEKIFDKAIEELYNRGYDKWADLLDKAASAVINDEEKSYTVNLTLNATVPNVYKVEYVLGHEEDEAVRAGFLPVGADVELFANRKDVDGYEILGWINEKRAEEYVAEMLEGDTRLYAVTDFSLTGMVDEVEGTELEAKYGESHTLAVVEDGVDYANYTYKWYLNDAIIDGETEATLNLTNLAVGDYVYEVVVTDDFTGEYRSIKFTVSVKVQEITEYVSWTINGVRNSTGKVSYNGSAYTVDAIIAIPGVGDVNAAVTKTFAYNGRTGTNAGKYTATLTLTVKDGYIFSDGETKHEYTYDWEIEKALLDIEFVWNYNRSIAHPYTGEEYSVSATIKILSPEFAQTMALDRIFDLKKVEYEGDLKAKEIGNYTAIADACDAVINENFQLHLVVGAVLHWSITDPVAPEKTKINAPTNKWLNAANNAYEFVVGEFETSKVAYIGLPEGYDNDTIFTVSDYTYTIVSSANETVSPDILKTTVGNYKVTVTVTFVGNNDLYELIGTTKTTFTFSATIAIKAGNLNLTGAAWYLDGEAYNADEAIKYDGKSKVFTLNGLSDSVLADVKVVYYTYENNVRGNKVTELKNAGRYIIDIESDYKLDNRPDAIIFEIHKATVQVPTVTLTKPTKENNAYVVDVEFSANDLYTMTKSGTLTATKKGTYKVTVTFTLNDATNYTFDNVDGVSKDGLRYVITLTWEAPEDIEDGQGGEEQTKGKTFKDEHSDITVEDLDGKVGEDDTLFVSNTSVNLSDYRKLLEEKYPDMKTKFGAAYEIHFNNAANEKQNYSNGKFRVTLPIPTDLLSYSENRLAVLHIMDDGTTEFVEGVKRDGDYMVFEIEGFSVFAVIGLDPLPAAVGSWWLILLIVLLVLLLIAAIILLVLRILKKNEEEPEEEPEQVEEPVEETVADEGDDDDDDDEEEVIAADDTFTPSLYLAPDMDPHTRIVLNRSFAARLSQAPFETRNNYNELKNYILSFKKVNSRISWRYDTFNKGRTKICKLQVRGKSIIMYVALDPKTLDEKYHHEDVSEVARYADIPTKLKIKSERSLKYAQEFIDMVMADKDIERNPNAITNDYVWDYPYMTTDDLIANNRIKVKHVAGRQFWENDANKESNNGENK